MVTENNIFRDYILYLLKKDVILLQKDNDRYKETLEAFETGLGYLIHS